MNDIFSAEDIHERILLYDLPVSEDLMGVSDSLSMALISLELSHPRPANGKSRAAVRRPLLHISGVQHDSTVILDDELAHHLRDFSAEDLKSEKIRQAVNLKILDQLPEKGGIDSIQVGCRAFAILVGLHLVGTSQHEDVAVHVRWLEVGDLGGFGPTPANRRERSPEHDAPFVNLEVSMDKVHSEPVLDVEALEEASQLLKVNLLHFGLVSIVWEKIVTVAG
jgi:hypothetical protein